MLTNRVPKNPRVCKPYLAIPQTRYEYQSHINGRLKHSKLAVIVFLLDKGARRGFSFWKQSNMARQLGIHQDTVRSALKELSAEGWIQVVRRGHFNEYLFPWHPAWARSVDEKVPERPPYKGNIEDQPPPLLNHNPDLQRQVEAEWAETVKETETVQPVNVTRVAYYGRDSVGLGFGTVARANGRGWGYGRQGRSGLHAGGCSL